MTMRWASNIGSISLSVLLFASVLVTITNSTTYADAEQAPINTATRSDEVTAASGSNRFVAWFDSTPGNNDISFKRSTDNGVTWKPTVNLSSNPGNSWYAQIAVSGPNVYVVWSDNTPGNYDIFIRRSTDNGATWKPLINLSSNLGGSYVPQIAISGSNVYVVWEQRNPDATLSDVFFRRSTDNGATWKPLKNLSSNGASCCPQVAVSGSNVYVVWTNNAIGTGDIFLRRSTDNGATWQPVKNLSNNPGPSTSPQIAVSGSNVYIAWIDYAPGNADIMLRRSTDNGATWKAVVNLSNNPGTSLNVQIAVSGSNVYLVWYQENADETLVSIFFRRSTDNGATWKPAVNFFVRGWSGECELFPQVAVSGSSVYLVWYDRGCEADISLKRSTDNGATWKSTLNLSNNSGASFEPQIVVSGSNVYVVWSDNTPGNQDVLFRRSIDSGATWNSIKNLSSNSGPSGGAQIAL